MCRWAGNLAPMTRFAPKVEGYGGPGRPGAPVQSVAGVEQGVLMELARGNVAVVTGAASGIGFALAERFATAGLNIVLADVQDDAMSAAADKISAHGVETLSVRTDVSKEAEVQALAAATIERFGAVHLVCNNAGVASLADPWFGPIKSWEWVLGVNLWGVIHGCRTFLPHLGRRRPHRQHGVGGRTVPGLRRRRTTPASTLSSPSPRTSTTR